MLDKTTEGNPFFLGEILRLMSAEGNLASDIPATARLRVPDRVRESITRRAAPLSDKARQTLPCR